MIEYSKLNVKLSDTLLKKLKTAVKNKIGTTLRISLKMVNGNNWMNSWIIIDNKRKNRNALNNNMSTDLKPKAQISKII